MDVTEDHFRTFRCSGPLLFPGTEICAQTFPVAQLLGTVSVERPYFDQMLLSDDLAEMLGFLKSH